MLIKPFGKLENRSITLVAITNILTSLMPNMVIALEMESTLPGKP